MLLLLLLQWRCHSKSRHRRQKEREQEEGSHEGKHADGQVRKYILSWRYYISVLFRVVLISTTTDRPQQTFKFNIHTGTCSQSTVQYYVV